MNIYVSICYLMVSVIVYGDGNCIVSVSDLRGGVPLYLLPNGGDKVDTAFYEPQDKKLVVKGGEDIVLVCAGRQKETNEVFGRATCIGDTTFSFRGEDKPLQSITCPQNKIPKPVAKPVGPYLETRQQFDVGFQTDDRFINHITASYNKILATPLWAKSVLLSSVTHCRVKRLQTWENKRSFDNGLDMKKVYQQQQATINRIMGYPEDSTKYISSDRKFNQGHLTSFCDFTQEAQQRLTCNYYNAAPQWMHYNERNWGQLEVNIRSFITNTSSQHNKIEVYTGIHGIAEFKDVNNIATPVYLYVNGTQKRVPVPNLFWKIIYDPVTTKGTAFVVNNNPLSTDVTPICPNVCGSISWLTWRPEDLSSGFGYCCEVPELRKKVPNVPKDFTVSGILA